MGKKTHIKETRGAAAARAQHHGSSSTGPRRKTASRGLARPPAGHPAAQQQRGRPPGRPAHHRWRHQRRSRAAQMPPRLPRDSAWYPIAWRQYPPTPPTHTQTQSTDSPQIRASPGTDSRPRSGERQGPTEQPSTELWGPPRHRAPPSGEPGEAADAGTARPVHTSLCHHSRTSDGSNVPSASPRR